jgi:site-specific DNA-methyltransferase (adenine-specific)
MNEYHNKDSMQVMDNMLEAGVKVDLIITDPPYKITARGNGGTSGGMFQKKEVNNGRLFKKNDLEIQDWLPKFYNLLEDESHCYIMTNNKNITQYLKAINEMYFNDDKKQKFHFVKNLIWVKDNKIMGQSYMSQFEYIIMLRKGKHKKINNCGDSDVIYAKNKKLKDEDNKTIHDTEKPVEVMETLIKNSSNEGDTVADFFYGIGATPVACKKLNRFFIGCEIDDKYFEKTVKRLREC